MGRAVEWMGVKPELKVKSVCKNCNNGWMNNLETSNIPLLGAFMQDIKSPISARQQYSLAQWSLKTAMVMESTTRKERTSFYTKLECENLRAAQIPPDTSVWIGRYGGNLQLAFVGSDSWNEKPEGSDVLHAYSSSIVFGLVVIQILSVHASATYRRPIRLGLRPGPWDQLLTQVWPPTSRIIFWPPQFGFTDMTQIGLGDLVHRFNWQATQHKPLKK